ncbi:MAG: YraN family protein [Calditrichaeota bacterium]|nr:YraN family protein [Calditrichota bacterium]
MAELSAVEKGREAETAAFNYLKSKGLLPLDWNFRTRYGEIDIVARDDQTLVFIEVKSNIKPSLAEPQMRVDFRKRRRLTLAAYEYFAGHKSNCQALRFDVLALKKTARGEWHIEHIIDAFRPEDINNLI